jgi:hypothetical protein
MDATVAKRLSASPQVFDVYSFCGMTILSEFYPHGYLEQAAVPGGSGYQKSEDLHDDKDVNPQNNLTAIEKLKLGTQMAEGLADLQGYWNGVIVHDDVQLSQFLYTANKSIVKINNFNQAEFMLWDDKHGKYCPYKNGKAHGIVCTEFTENSVSNACLSTLFLARAQ